MRWNLSIPFPLLFPYALSSFFVFLHRKSIIFSFHIILIEYRVFKQIDMLLNITESLHSFKGFFSKYACQIPCNLSNADRLSQVFVQNLQISQSDKQAGLTSDYCASSTFNATLFSSILV